MSRYQLKVTGDLFFSRAALKQERLVRVATLLIDTGSSYTIISWQALESLGIDPAVSKIRRSLMTANGLIQVPEVRIEEFHCFGKMLKAFPLVAHTIPLGGEVTGVLGMNFLRQQATSLDFMRATIEV